MSKVKNVEKRIWDLEGFDVVIRKEARLARSWVLLDLLLTEDMKSPSF
jgi:hypothetical protein